MARRSSPRRKGDSPLKGRGSRRTQKRGPKREQASPPRREGNRASAALRETEEQFHAMVEAVADYAIFGLDTQGRVTTWNAGAKRIKGYEASELLGEHYSVFYSERDVQEGEPQRQLDLAKSDGRFEAEGWRVRKNGAHFWANVVITALYDPQGVLRGFVKITRDRTEQKKAEERFRVVVEALPTGIVMVNRAGAILLVNALTEKLFGYGRPELLGQPIEILVPERFRTQHP